MSGRLLGSCSQQAEITAANAAGVSFGKGSRLPAMTEEMMSSAVGCRCSALRRSFSQNSCGEWRVSSSHSTTPKLKTSDLVDTLPLNAKKSKTNERRICKECCLQGLSRPQV